MAMGLTFQQIQKYENGTNRIATSTLLMYCNAIGISASDFLKEFEGSFDAISKPFSPEAFKVAMLLDEIPEEERGAFTTMIFQLHKYLCQISMVRAAVDRISMRSKQANGGTNAAT
jgi:transcriptional regulator with XRE-family HTH domain